MEWQSLEQVMDQCMDEELVIGKYLLSRSDLKQRIERLFDRRMYLEIPLDPVNLFTPLSIFDPEQNCFSLSAVEEMKLLLDQIGSACNECPSLFEGDADE